MGSRFALIGPYVYNLTLSDCRRLVNERMESLEAGLYGCYVL
nr:DUF2164 family protein [Paenibacillus bouchesdurhonensis]